MVIESATPQKKVKTIQSINLSIQENISTTAEINILLLLILIINHYIITVLLYAKAGIFFFTFIAMRYKRLLF